VTDIPDDLADLPDEIPPHDEITRRLRSIPAEVRDEAAGIWLSTTAQFAWTPNKGPQAAAYACLADELFYGGQAGGGKTSLGLGLALTAHKRSLILRRITKDAVKLAEQVTELLRSRDGYNVHSQQWRLPLPDDFGERLIQFAGCEHEEDKQRFKGDPYDLIYFDEGTDFLVSQYRFIIGWNRSADENQRCRVVVGSNPPTTAEGLWVIRHWSPWLDPLHPRPANPGELRWFTTGPDGADVEVTDRGPHLVNGETVLARSRTYIPARLADNPDLRATGYAAVLAGLPEELRRAYRDGNFAAGLKDTDFQVIPTAWIEAAQRRWRADGGRGTAMTAIGIDVAQGGADFTVLAARHGGWYAPLVRKPGVETRDGSAVAAAVVALRRDRCVVIVDVDGGWGGDTVARLKGNGIPVTGFKGSGASHAKTRNRHHGFYNKRAEAWWRMREELDPQQDFGSALALPPDASVKADLAAPRWELTTRGIRIEDKNQIRKRLGRSPDDGDAIVMCLSEGTRAAAAALRRAQQEARPERANVGYAHLKKPGA
jgi:Terminase large subunit, T4likevirus-type, N-terminal